MELLRGSLSGRDPGVGLLARLAAFERGAGHRLRGGIAEGVEPVRDAPRDPEEREGRHRQGHPRAATPREEASPPEAHCPRAQLLPKASAPHAICRSPHPRDANRKRRSRVFQQGLDQKQDEGRRDALVGERHRTANPHIPCLVEVRPLRCSVAANLPRTGAAGVRIPKPATTQHLENGKLAGFTL